MSVTFAFLHHLCFVALVVLLTVEMVLLRQPLTLDSARRLIAVDGFYGAFAGALLAIGLLRVFYFEKGFYYYWSSHAFLTKFGLFILVGLLSVIPTIEFMRWRKRVRAGEIPQVAAEKLRRLRTIVHVELAGIVLILFFAAWMARGAFR